MMHTHRAAPASRTKNTAPMKSLLLVAQKRLTEVYFGEPAACFIQATKPLTVQTETGTVHVKPGREWRGDCRWLRFKSTRGGAVILRHNAPKAFVEEL